MLRATRIEINDKNHYFQSNDSIGGQRIIIIIIIIIGGNNGV